MVRLTLLAAFAACLRAATWEGAISDAGCGARHANGGGEACVRRCVAKGAAPVLVSNGQVLRIANPDKAGAFLGKRVVVTGQMVKGVVTVETVKAR